MGFSSRPPSYDALFPGAMIGRYRLIVLVGRGGMGEVWKARLDGARGIAQSFAVKLLRADLVGSEEHRTALVEEARVASQLRSPNIAQLVELVEENDRLALVLEWVDGTSLSKLLVEGPLPLGVALRIAADVCAGLHAAHELTDLRGQNLELVHRDISPQNVLLDRNGCTKVVDFGIAKSKGRLLPDTVTGIKGKLAYMSREQAGGEVLDRRADVYSVGVVLYEILTGRLPFEASNELAALSALLTRAQPRPLSPSVPSSVAAILRRALSHERERRFSSALEMRNAIEAAMVDLSVPTDTVAVAQVIAAGLPLESARVLPGIPSDPAGVRPISEPPVAPSLPPQKRRSPVVMMSILMSSVAVALLVVASPAAFPSSVNEPRTHRTVEPIERTRADDWRGVEPHLFTGSPSSPHHEPTRVAPNAALAPSSLPASEALPVAKPTAESHCDPPYVVDANGHRQYRTECFR
jgi:eukaryotic-like serine/threonine-protein kinase